MADATEAKYDELTDSRHLDGNVLPRGECLVSSHSMLLNCENTSPDHERICPCVALPMIKATTVTDASHLTYLLAFMPNQMDIEVG